MRAANRETRAAFRRGFEQEGKISIFAPAEVGMYFSHGMDSLRSVEWTRSSPDGRTETILSEWRCSRVSNSSDKREGRQRSALSVVGCKAASQTDTLTLETKDLVAGEALRVRPETVGTGDGVLGGLALIVESIVLASERT